MVKHVLSPVLFLALTFLGISSCYAEKQWSWENPGSQGLQGNLLKSIWSVDENNIYAAGQNGTVMFFNGHTWNRQSISSADLNGIWASSTDNVYAVGGWSNSSATQIVKHFNGAEWTTIDIGADQNLHAIYGTDENNIFVGGWNGRLYHYDGNAWQQRDFGTNSHINAFWGDSNGRIYAAADRTTIRSFSGGSWGSMRIPNDAFGYDFSDIWGVDDNNVFAVGSRFDNNTYHSIVLHFDGSAWTTVYRFTDLKLTAVYGSSLNDIYVASGQGHKEIYRFNGSSLSGLTKVGDESWIYDIWLNDQGDGFFVGAFGDILKKTGSTIRNLKESITDTAINALWCDSDDYAVGFGLDGSIIEMKNGVWNVLDDVNFSALRSAWGNDPNNIFAVGDNGTIMHFNGTQWQAMSSGTAKDLNSVWGLEIGGVVAAGDGIVLHYDGSSWWNIGPNTNPVFNDVWGTTLHNLYAVSRGDIYHFDNSSWKIVNTGFTYPLADPVITGTAADDIQVIYNTHVYQFDGASWSEAADTLVFVDDVVATSANDYFYAAGFGEAYHYNGLEWSALNPPTSQSLKAACVRPNGDLLVAGNNGTIMRYSEIVEPEAPALSVTSPQDNISVSALTPLTFSASATDPQEGDISQSIQWFSDQVGLIGMGASLSVSLPVGVHEIRVIVVDADGHTDEQSLTVTVENQAPSVHVLAPTSNAIFETGQSILLQGEASDIEDGDISSAIQWQSDSEGTLGSGAQLSVAQLSQGSHTLTAQVLDSEQKVGTAVVPLSVINPGPKVLALATFVNEGESVMLNPLLNATDNFEGVDVSSLVISKMPSHGSVTVNADGLLLYQHNGSESSSDTLSYRVSDNAGAQSDNGLVQLSIIPVNDAPSAFPDAFTVPAGDNTVLAVLNNDVDPEGALDITSLQIVSAPAFGTVTVNADGTVTYLHDGSDANTDSFAYRINDNAGLVSQETLVNLSIVNKSDLFPINIDFSQGLPGQDLGWSYFSSNSGFGRIQVAEGVLRMDVSADSHFNLNEAVYTVDLFGARDVVLSFFQADFSDESHLMPSVFTGHHNSDGVAISNDGVTWYAVVASDIETTSSGRQYTIDLDAKIAEIQANHDAGFNYGSNFRIKFQQYDNYTYPTDGRAWDNIQLNANFSQFDVQSSAPLNVTLMESQLETSGCQDFALSNFSAQPIIWQGSTAESWLSLSSESGELAPGSNATVEVCWNMAEFAVGDSVSSVVSFIGGNNERRDFFIAVNIVADNHLLPFQENFSAGLPTGNEWQFSSSNNFGRIAVNSGVLRMDVTTSGNYSLNEAILTLDLQGLSGLQLSFFQRETSDELNSMPESFSGQSNADGVAISADGITWYRIVNASQLDVGTAGKTYAINLDEEIARIKTSFDSSFAYTQSFKIKFQQYDNYVSPTDGREWDNISITQ